MVNYTPHLVKRASEIDTQSGKTAEEIMLKSAMTISSDMDITEACDLIEKHSMTGAPIVNEFNKLIGFLSQKDCIKYMLDMKYYNQAGGKVVDYMSKSLITIHPSEQILYITELFLKNHFLSYPVVDDEGIYLGLVTRDRLFCELNKLKQTSW